MSAEPAERHRGADRRPLDEALDNIVRALAVAAAQRDHVRDERGQPSTAEK